MTTVEDLLDQREAQGLPRTPPPEAIARFVAALTSGRCIAVRPDDVAEGDSAAAEEPGGE